MTPDASDPDPLPPRLSLVGHAAARLRARMGSRSELEAGPLPATRPRRIALILPLVLAAGPLATIAGAALLTRAARQEEARIATALAPRMDAEQERGRARQWLRQAIEQPGPAAMIDRLAAALPADATLLRVERRADAQLEIEVATSDPDALRAALRRTAALSGLRDVRQREAEGRTIVLLRRAGA